MNKCQWCRGTNNDDPDTETLCRSHLAEYEGLSENELDRMEDEQAREML